MIKPLYVAMLIIGAILASLGQLMFKLSASSLTLNIISILTNHKFIIGLALYGLATLVFVYVLKYVKLSIAYPFVALSYVLVYYLSSRILNEPTSVVGWIGVLFIVTGIFLISLTS